MEQQMIPIYSTKTFTQVWESATSFLNEWKSCALYSSDLITDANINRTFYLLYARYGNSPIANRDVNQFKYKVWSILFQYAPSWQKELDIQVKLRGLDLDSDSIYTGSRVFYNHAYNPSTIPDTTDTEQLPYIDDQNTTNYKKSLLEGLSILDDLIKADVTENFLNRFKRLFKIVVASEYPVLYEAQ